MKQNNHIIWASFLLVIIFIMCVTILILFNKPFVIRFEMDNNTKEAIQSINYSAIASSQIENQDCPISDECLGIEGIEKRTRIKEVEKIMNEASCNFECQQRILELEKINRNNTCPTFKFNTIDGCYTILPFGFNKTDCLAPDFAEDDTEKNMYVNCNWKYTYYKEEVYT